jgi:hypothetical protein
MTDKIPARVIPVGDALGPEQYRLTLIACDALRALMYLAAEDHEGRGSL